MSRTITALFDTRADADAGSERLRQAGVDASHVHVHDQSSHKTSGAYSTHQDRGLWASIKNAFLPDEDRHTYEEGIRRGGFLLTADVDEESTPAAVRALEEANSIDLDERSQQWRSDGWNYAGRDRAGGTNVAGSSLAGDDDEFDRDDGPGHAGRSALTGIRDPEYGTGKYRSYYRSDDDRI